MQNVGPKRTVRGHAGARTTHSVALVALFLFALVVAAPGCTTPSPEARARVASEALLTNLALSQPAIQSSTLSGAAAGRAVDGNEDGDFGHGSVAHTSNDVQPYWQVDLGASHLVDHVMVFNRTDCCQSRLANFYVLLSDAPLDPRLSFALAQPGVRAQFVAGGGNEATVGFGSAGRYVRVQLAGADYLQLAEVKVMGAPDGAPASGVPGPSLALRGSATQSSDLLGALAGRALDGNEDGNFWAGSVSHTNRDVQAWWQVDLGASQFIDHINVFNRTDCCQSRLSNFYVLTSDAPLPASLSEALAQGGVGARYVASVANVASIPIGSSGRFVRIQLAGIDYLQLAEVEIAGSAVCAASTCGAPDGHGGYCYPGSGCISTCGGAALPYTPAGADALGDTRDRFGIYDWNVDTRSFPTLPTTACAARDRLNWGACMAQSTGARTIRVALEPNDPYLLGLSPRARLRDIAATPAYRELFSRPFTTYLLTTYSAADLGSPWVSGAQDYAAEQEEIAELGTYLLNAFPCKRFILLNWEGDNAVGNKAYLYSVAQGAPNAALNSETAWRGFADWTRARVNGVAQARKNKAGALYAGVEFALSRNFPAGDAPCDNADLSRRCLVSYLASNPVGADYYSYSEYQSGVSAVDGHDLNADEVAAQLTADLDRIQGTLGIARSRLIIGEYGQPAEKYAPEDAATERAAGCGAALRVAATQAALLQWGPSYAIQWQIVDNRPDGLPDGFGLWDAALTPRPTHELFANLFALQRPALPLCGR